MDITYYTTYDLPVPYKNLLLYPVAVSDYMLFSAYSNSLTIEKNSTNNIKIIKMSNLEYIYYLSATDESQPILLWFDRLLAMVLKDEKSFEKIENSINRYKYNEKGKAIFYIGEEVYTSADFEEIKKIICEQNLVELIDESISKEVRDSLEAAMEYKRKMSGKNPTTLEDYIISFMVATHWSLDKINSLSVRKFISTIRRYDNLVHYKIYLAASMSGMVEFKDKSFINHWLSNLDNNDRYKDVSVDLDAVQDNISMESAKAKAKAKYT